MRYGVDVTEHSASPDFEIAEPFFGEHSPRAT